MLTTDQIATILRDAGVDVPAFPAPRRRVQDSSPRNDAPLPPPESFADAGKGAAEECWISAIQTLYVEFTVARAARGLRNAEQARSDLALRSTPSDAWERN